MGFMEEQYKGDVIRVTTEKDNTAFPWKPICTILDGASREVIKQIDWQIGYRLVTTRLSKPRGLD